MVINEQNERPGPKPVTILGSTGSIGCNTLDLIQRNPSDYKVEAITANTNFELLAAQAKETNASLAVVADENKYKALKDALNGTTTEVAAGQSAVIEAASRPADWVMAGIVGAAGLEPTLTAIKRGVVLALANKECLVTAGDLFLSEVDKSGTTLLPVDSEHNAIFQVFEFDQRLAIEKIILTASGGPFWGSDFSTMQKATPSEAISHPNWDMGKKISVDSATMMNKGLELIEAHYLFSIAENKIEILVHVESIVHSLVSYVDGSVLAQLGSPDMRTPISYALGWPKRISAPSPRLDLATIGTLNFEKTDPLMFPAIELCREALREGGSAPAILNAANEVAVDAFLNGKIGFLDIVSTVDWTLNNIAKTTIHSLADVFSADHEARMVAKGRVSAGPVIV